MNPHRAIPVSPRRAAPDGSGQPPATPIDRPLRRALPWPDDLLSLFSLRMSSHGMSISRIDMLNDARYALQQLRHARDLSDATLQLIVDQLFRFFEAFQSGLPRETH